MSHSIKIKDETYKRLQELQRPRESYDEVITRLIHASSIILKAGDAVRLETRDPLQAVPHD